MHEMNNLFYRAHGARYGTALIHPTPVVIDHFPRNALLHFHSSDFEEPNVDGSKPYFNGYSQKIKIDLVLDYNPHQTVQGNHRRATLNLNDAIRTFRRKNITRFVFERDASEKDHNENNLIVVNYSYIEHLYKYTMLQITPYQIWANRMETIYRKMEDLATKTSRNQFFFYPVPSVLVGRTILDKYIDMPPSPQMLHTVMHDGDASLMLLDIWRWLSPSHRKMSLLSRISPNNYNKINFIFHSKEGKEILINLGYLNSWIKGENNRNEMGTATQYSETAMKNLWLKLMMSLNSMNIEEDIDLNEVNVIAEDGNNTEVNKAGTDPTRDLDHPDNGHFSPDLRENKDSSTEEDLSGIVEEDDSDSIGGASELVVGVTDKAKNTDKAEAFKQVNPDVIKAAAIDQHVDAPEIGVSNLTHKVMKDVAADVEALDKLTLKKLADNGEQLNDNGIPTAPEKEYSKEEVSKEVLTHSSSVDRVRAMLEKHAEGNLLTAAEYRKANAVLQEYSNSPDPYGSGKKRVEAMVVKPESIKINKEDKDLNPPVQVVDQSMHQSSLKAFDKKYLKEVYKSDMLAMVDNLQRGGVLITDHQIDRKDSVLGSHEVHTLSLKPLFGAPSNVTFVVPVISPDGTFKSGGNRYLMRKQRTDCPLRKIAPAVVALSTYYGKTFVEVNQKVANNSIAYLCRQINLSIFDKEAYIQNVVPGDVFDNYFKAPLIYSALSSEYVSLQAGPNKLVFDHHKREELADPSILSNLEKNGRILCGMNGRNYIVVDKNNQFFICNGTAEHAGADLGDIYSLLNIDPIKAPIDFTEVRVFSKYIPLGLVLGYCIGFHKLLKLLDVKYRLVEPRKNKGLGRDEYAVSFKDVTYVFNRQQRAASLIMAGFTDYEKTIKSYDVKDFDSKGVYLNLLMSKGMNAVYIRELDMMESYFVDPISREILETRHEPQTFNGLLLRSAEMLTTYTHPKSQDRNYMRDRGYERISGAVYKEMVTAIRQFNNRGSGPRSKITISPYQVWNAIMKDNSVKIAEDINPIQNLKESEVITYAGTGGRDKDSMNKESRAMHVSDIGIASESTVDSSAVGTIFYMSANPNIDNVRGLAEPEKQLGPANLLSTSALVSPAATNDIVKRIMFISTQMSHVIPSPGYKQPYVNTGYEYVIPLRTSQLFSYAAENDGKVLSLDEKGMVIEYAHGEKVGVNLGRQYGVAEGTTYPHDVVANVKVGEKFKKGLVLAYNTKFFEPDFIDHKTIVLKNSGFVNTVFFEGKEVHEDSCTISDRIGDKFSTEVTKVKSYIIDFNQNLLNVVKVGTEVNPKDVLMIIEDAITASSGNFSEDDLSTLKRLSNSAPRSNVRGLVEKIEVFYHGEKSDMSASLKSLADRSDREMKERAISTSNNVVTGRVTDEYRVSGVPLGLDKAEIRIYINVVASSGVGDKGSFGHQMKSTISMRHSNAMCTDDGEDVDATFSYRSVAARGVMSAALVGTTISLLDFISKKAASIYEG